MIPYSPTTLLPSSPPYTSLDEVMDSLCDKCLQIQYYDKLTEVDKEQYFELTMSLLSFWDYEFEKLRIDESK
jgi:hypothetical protein